MKKLIKTGIVMAASSALFVPAAASALTLTHPTGTTAPVGTKLRATNVAHAETEKNIELELSDDVTIKCKEMTITGELTKNNGGEAVEGNVTAAEFRGHPGTTESNDCDGPLGTVTVTPSHTWDGIHNPGTGLITSLPWCVKAMADHTFTVRGRRCNEVARPLTFLLHMTNPRLDCAYERANVVGSYTTHPNAAVGTIFSQEFRKIPATASIFCPATGKLTMAFTLEDDTGGSPQDVYLVNGT